MKTVKPRRRAKVATVHATHAMRIAPEVDFDRELASLFDLTGKVALLPGGYGGIGEAVAWGLAQRGADVVLAGRSRSKAETLARRMRGAGHKGHGIALDAADVPAMERAVDAVARRFGRIDILVNCVGTQIEEPIGHVTEAAFDQVVSLNLKAAMFLAQAVARHQIAAGRGGKQMHLLSVRSQLGLRDRGYSAYCSSKLSLIHI